MPAGSKADRLYIDEDASAASFIAALPQAGFDVLTAAEAHNLRLSDEDQLAFATSVQRAVYSFNTRDYQRIHTEWTNAGRTHAGIILVQQRRLGIGDQVRELTLATVGPLENRIIYLPAKSTML